MARKSKKAKRLTLDDVKAQIGKYLVATLEGAVGPMSVEAIAPLYSPANIKLPHLLLQANVVSIIDDIWLDDGRFRRLYDQYEYIKVWRTDELPVEPKLYELPSEIEARLSSISKNNAYRIATSPFVNDPKHPSYIMIWTRNEGAAGERATLEWELKIIRPFLQAVKIYEQRFNNRPEVLKEVDTRLKMIAEKTSVEAQLSI